MFSDERESGEDGRMKEKSDIFSIVKNIGLAKLVIIIVAGVLLVVLSFPQAKSDDGKKTNNNVQEKALDAMKTYTREEERAIEKALSQVEGVGEVKVMLTLASSEEKVPLQNSDISEQSNEESDKSGMKKSQSDTQSKNENVLVQNDGSESPYVVQINAPKIEGAVVVAKGAGSVEIEKEIIDAIVALFPIEAHKIKVMKMK